MDDERGETTALPHEVGNNLPLLKTDLDARGLPEYAEKWCAELCLHPDGDPSVGGISRVKKWGKFGEMEAEQRWKRRIVKGAEHAWELAQVLRD
jgi:hypothetical protein